MAVVTVMPAGGNPLLLVVAYHSFMDILCQLCENYKKFQQNLGQMRELFRRLDAAHHGTDDENISTSQRGDANLEANFLESELPGLSSDHTPVITGNISTSQGGDANLEANFLESELPGLSSDHTPVITGNISTSQGGDANFEASFLEFELPGLSSDYTPESYPVITEPAPADSCMANSQGTNEGEQITLNLSVTAWSTEEIQVPDELEETEMEIQVPDELEETEMEIQVPDELEETEMEIQVPDELEETEMEIQVSDELEETWMQEDGTMFFEAYLDYLEIQMKEDA
ncbi:hypothetical protein BDL97_16G091800 [Sphagnum fallax]|nr:hypothetical protein BDL97_16G091800 [Sphagnum fallax]